MRRVGIAVLELLIGTIVVLAALALLTSQPGFIALPTIGGVDLPNLVWARHFIPMPSDFLVLVDIAVACWAIGWTAISAARRISGSSDAPARLPLLASWILVVLLALQGTLFLVAPLSRDGRISLIGPIPGDDSPVVGGKVYLKVDYSAIPLAACCATVTICFLSDFLMKSLWRTTRRRGHEG